MGTAHTAREAVERAVELRPDLVLLNQYLPDAVGASLLRELTGDVIMLTAAAGMQEVRTALDAGVVGYLIEPFEERDLAGRYSPTPATAAVYAAITGSARMRSTPPWQSFTAPSPAESVLPPPPLS